jgi:hypothetical protein
MYAALDMQRSFQLANGPKQLYVWEFNLNRLPRLFWLGTLEYNSNMLAIIGTSDAPIF